MENLRKSSKSQETVNEWKKSESFLNDFNKILLKQKFTLN